jgi:putative DNA primase/helicase
MGRWTYDHGVPVHSPILASTSADPNSGKSTLVVAIGYATPRFKHNVEITGATLYRFVDQYKPTTVLDEAGDILKRRTDLKHIINGGHARATAKIPRQEKLNGRWTTVFFDVFTPKAIALIGSNLPLATRTRCIEIRMVPKREDEKIEDFSWRDDPEFAILRRKFARWAVDNAAALKDAKPTIPPGLNNRAADNWRLLLAIANLAGGSWPERAREAAIRITNTRHKPSLGAQLLAEFKAYASTGKGTITSEDAVKYLCRDPNGVWVEYNRGGPITQRQIAILLDQYEIEPGQLHPTAKSDFARRGYTFNEKFEDAFARHVPSDPIIRSSEPKQSAKKPKKPKKSTKKKSTPKKSRPKRPKRQ